MKINPFEQARKIEILADELYDELTELYGSDNEQAFKAMKLMSWAFCLSCDLEEYLYERNEPEARE